MTTETTFGFDAATIGDLEPAELVKQDRVAGRMYTDPEIFELEMKNIFERTWIWVAHESELPKAGSFKSTHVGRTPVIVTRDRKGNIRTLVNRCRHRGASLCEQRTGQANGFTCPYHAWSYGLDGQLRGIPYPEGYEGVMDKSQMSLRQLRTESYAGLIFATLDEEIEPLEEFLGDVKLWIDRFMKQGGGYPIKVLGTHQFTFSGNWKIQLENTTDGYHFPIVHRSWMASVDAETADMMSFMTDPEAVIAELVRVRAQGYAAIDQEVEEGLRSVAVPLLNARGRVIAALNTGLPASGPVADLTGRYLPALLGVQAQLKPILR